MRRLLHPFLAVTVLVALTGGVPVPRVVPVDTGTCEDLCRVRAGCTPCPATAEDLPCREARGIQCQICVLCQCGIGILSPEIPLPAPLADETEYSLPERLLHPVPGEPASPPPKAAA